MEGSARGGEDGSRGKVAEEVAIESPEVGGRWGLRSHFMIWAFADVCMCVYCGMCLVGVGVLTSEVVRDILC